MDNCKLLLKRYNKLQKLNKNIILRYNSFNYKGLCRQDATVGVDTSKKIIIKLNKTDNYYDKLKIHIKNCINVIIKQNKHLLNAISRSYNFK